MSANNISMVHLDFEDFAVSQRYLIFREAQRKGLLMGDSDFDRLYEVLISLWDDPLQSDHDKLDAIKAAYEFFLDTLPPLDS